MPDHTAGIESLAALIADRVASGQYDELAQRCDELKALALAHDGDAVLTDPPNDQPQRDVVGDATTPDEGDDIANPPEHPDA